MKKNSFLMAFTGLVLMLYGCNKNPVVGPPAKKYPADVATEWMKLQISLTKTTPGFNSVVSNRSFGYAGLTLYESIAPGISGGISLLPQWNVYPTVKVAKQRNAYYWPASVNAAMAVITKSLFANTSPANMSSIDSLEAVFATKFESQATDEQLSNAASFGKSVATAIFEWSKSDGAHEPYLHITDPAYVPPVGPGLWIPTPPLFGKPVLPHWGDNRTFVPGIAEATQPEAPMPYSSVPGSPFYEMANNLYRISLSLTDADIVTVKFWADGIPGSLNVPAHATNILIQLVQLNKLNLEEAAIAYCKHSMAVSDAIISCFKTKYHYNLIRPVSYIRGEMGHSDWNSVITTPSFPEYTAAHAVVSAASATIMESIFGRNYGFTDHTYDASFGPRSFDSFNDYANDAGYSRVLGGIHYAPSVKAGLMQGRKVGEKINQLFKIGGGKY